MTNTQAFAAQAEKLAGTLMMLAEQGTKAEHAHNAAARAAPPATAAGLLLIGASLARFAAIAERVFGCYR